MSSLWDETLRDMEYAQIARRRIPELERQVADLKAELARMNGMADETERFLLELSAAFTVSGQAVTASGIANQVRRFRAMRGGGVTP